MVEPIGPRPLAKDRKIAPASRVATSVAAAPVAKQAKSVEATTLAAQLSSSAPVDMDRVKMIKQAIADGNFPLSPATIADQLIAARFEWLSND